MPRMLKPQPEAQEAATEHRLVNAHLPELFLLIVLVPLLRPEREWRSSSTRYIRSSCRHLDLKIVYRALLAHIFTVSGELLSMLAMRN
jgi:hypothetical protein